MDSVYLKVSALWFFEFAVWGAWMPVLAARLLGPLKMSGKQTGWIYATLPLASMVSPLIFGWLADTYVNVEVLLLISHVAGAVLLFLAAKQTRFTGVFVVMLLYSFFYAASLALVNVMVFRHVSGDMAPKVFIWAPIAWALVGYFLTGLRQMRKSEGDGSDALYLAAVLSVILAVVCLIQPATPPVASQGQPMAQAFGMLSQFSYLIFIIVSFAVAGMMQFYFLGSAPFMQAMGISSKNVPATMAIAQAMQAVATWLALAWLWAHAGPKWTLAIGAACWAGLYVIYVMGKPRWLIVIGQSLHGLAYVFFINGGWMFTDIAAPKEISASAQALLILATNGIGLFLGTQLAGFTMDKCKAGDQFQWRAIWTVPLAITLAGAVILAVVFWPQLPVAQC